MSEIEEWRPVVTHPGKYEVSSLGRVRNARTGLIRKLSLSRRGYPLIGLCGDYARAYPLHRIVSEAFLGPMPIGLECAHLNGDKLDARASNLKYVTRRENHSHKREHGTQPHGEGHHNAVLTESVVRHMRANAETSRDSRRFAEELGVSRYATTAAITGKTWAHIPGAHPLRDLRAKA